MTLDDVTGDRRPGDVLDLFDPVVRSWFTRQFPNGPTQPQRAAWPLIAQGKDVLVASPTGTGKTLTGFLVAIDAACRSEGSGSGAPSAPQVVYVSPLRALAADVHQNLQVPLEGIRAEAELLGLPAPRVSVATRTGDTPPAERRAMQKTPPNLLVTTPESLYLLLTAASSRALLRHVRTVIVDEVHTLARDKRGSHLALSLERLAHLVEGDGGRLQRIGLSATQRPLELVARMLCGTGPDRPMPEIIDCGHQRDLDVSIELPDAELEAVAPAGQFGEVLDRIAELVRAHRTTLVFVNTRKLAERVAHQLAERLDTGIEGESFVVAAHHGSLSAERRRIVEARLRAGSLKALVATASLELGIDVGPVELVCQIGSPRSIGTFLQRVGRANHHLEGTPSGRLFPLTRDELVECVALLCAVRSGELDQLHPQDRPLDVLAQQIVAEVAGEEQWDEQGLLELVRRAAPYGQLTDDEYRSVIELVCEGIMTGRGRRGAYVHRDGVNGLLRPRRGARMAALMSGGAIPETGDYKVVLDPDGVTVGSVHEDFAVEATIGDIFLLGTHSWQVKKVEVGTVRVHDAGQLPPTIPFWLGEAPARTMELSAEVSRLRSGVEERLIARDEEGARALVRERAGTSGAVADQVVAYLEAGFGALGALPTQQRLIVERFFDDSEGTQLVIHSPFGGAVNRAYGLALRKRFCVSFDFELQASADDDTVSLSLGPQHSFPLSQVPSMLPSRRAEEALTQAILPHPMFAARWRWNLNRSLVVPRSRNGQRRPIHLQRMEADDLLAATWPALAACQENAPPGPIPVPDHVLARQTVKDCLHEALDVDGLLDVLRGLESGSIEMKFVESVEPSPLAHGILTGRPYTFLDGAPLEERRSRAVPIALGLAPRPDFAVEPSELAPLDPAAVRVVLEQSAPNPRDPDELHDLLLSLVAARPVERWRSQFDALVASGRASVVEGCWVPTERLALAASLSTDDEAAAACVNGHLEVSGPVSLEELVADAPFAVRTVRGAPLSAARAKTALARLEAAGSAIQLPSGAWCARYLLVRMHAASRTRRRSRVEPASIARFVQFLARWQHVAPGSHYEGRAGLLQAIEQLAGIEVPAGEWEAHVLPARVAGYQAHWLDELCLAGEVAWGRLTPRAEGSESADGQRRGATTPSPATPLALAPREDLAWLLAAVRVGDPVTEPAVGVAAEVLEALRERGASFRADLPALTRRMPHEVDEGLWDLVARGLVTADAFSAVRSLLHARRGRGAPQTRLRARHLALARRRTGVGTGTGEGRWSLMQAVLDAEEGGGGIEELAEAVAWQLLTRWGVVAWELWSRESFKVPWREVIRALRRLEARGLALGGRFVAGLAGEQYAMPEAAELLNDTRRSEDRHDELVVVAAADPLNLTGTVLGGRRVPAVRHRSVAYRGGVVVEDHATSA